MGWFAVAALLGALLWGLWSLSGPYTKQAHARIVVRSTVALILGLVVWAALFECSLRPTRIADAIGHGRVARFLLGLALGFVLAHALHTRAIRRLNFLWLALVVAILALAAPRIDNWLSRLTGIKAAVVELQFATNTSHKIAVASNLEAYATEGAFSLLHHYWRSIQSDIDFVEQVEIPDLKEQKKDTSKQQVFMEQAKVLRQVFKTLVSELAKCYSEAIKKGASIQRLQGILRPLARDAQQLANNQNEPKFKGQAEVIHRQFWEGLIMSASEFDKSRSDWGVQCAQVTASYRDDYPSILGEQEAYPRISQFSGLPYLYVGTAILLMTVSETDAALKLLENATGKVGEHLDYASLLLLAQSKFYQGRPAVDIGELYEKMSETAVERRKRVKRHCKSGICSGTLKELEDRHRRAEIIALNQFVYLASEDLARGIGSARGLEAKTVKFARRLKKLADADKLLGLDLYTILDTYAYAQIVVEAQRSNPDVTVFQQMRRILEDVVAKREEQASEKRTKEAYHGLNDARLHYQSARELSGE